MLIILFPTLWQFAQVYIDICLIISLSWLEESLKKGEFVFLMANTGEFDQFVFQIPYQAFDQFHLKLGNRNPSNLVFHSPSDH